MGCVKKGEGDVFSVGILDEPTKDTMEGEIEGTEESKLNISAMLPRLSTALPCLTLLKQHGHPFETAWEKRESIGGSYGVQYHLLKDNCDVNKFYVIQVSCRAARFCRDRLQDSTVLFSLKDSSGSMSVVGNV